MKQGEIYLIDFDPSVGHEYRKQRPAVIIQSTSLIRKSGLITVIPFSSQTHKAYKDDILVRADQSNKLFCDSVLKVHSICSFDTTRFVKKIGIIDSMALKKIKAYVKKHFGL